MHALAALLAAAPAWGQPAASQRGGTFVEPPARIDPAYLPPGPDQVAQPGDGERRLVLRLTAELPLRSAAAAGQGTQGTRAGSPTVQALLRWQPLDDPGWFGQLVLFRHLDADRQRPWDPDFTYAFGYEDEAPGRWSLVYANYTGTRWKPGRGEGRFNLPQGQWTASWRFLLPPPLEQVLLVGDGDAAACRTDANWVPRFTRADGEGLGRDKLSFALGCRYTRPGGWFAHATAFAWPDGRRQQPWDPDYTYGAGWTSPGPGGVTVQYNNYSGNRWRAGDRGPGEGQLRSGSLSVSWDVPW
jgi:hypothetical protein